MLFLVIYNIKSVSTYIEILDAIAKIGDIKKFDKSAHKIITLPL